MNPVIDRATALERLDGDTELLRELIALFLGEAAALLSTIRTGLAERDAVIVRQAAHSLKGAAANLAAIPVFAAAKQLEDLGRDGDLSSAAAVFATLEAEVERLTRSGESAVVGSPSSG
jgi:two-component system sensor histidine kinase/response regulator